MAHKVIYQAWEGHDRWSGPEATAGSLHLTEADRAAFVADYMALNRKSQSAPDYYEGPTDRPRTVEVDDETFAKVSASKNGVRANAMTTTSFQIR